MLDVLGIVLPIYLLIGTGFLLTRRGTFSEAEIRALSRFILTLALPALTRPRSPSVMRMYSAGRRGRNPQAGHG